MYDELKKKIFDILGDEDHLGGPMQRVYPRPIRESLASSICAEVEELLAAGQEEEAS
jgi:hypothetical protein